MDASNDFTASSTISSSTQNRILIWRSEVVAASSPSYSSSTPSAPSLTTTTTTTTTSSSSLPPSALAALSRGRRFWNKITTRLSSVGRRNHHPRRGSATSGDAPDFLMTPPRKDEPVARTAMYRMPPTGQPAVVVADGGGGLDEEVVPGEASSHGDGAARGRALLEKQERLHRAARLLNQGAR